MMCIRICLIQLRIYVYFWITWGVCFAINWREVLGETENSGPDQMPMCEDRCHDEVSLIITTLTYLCEDLSMSYLPSSLLFDSCIRLCIFQLVHSDHWVGRQWGILPFLTCGTDHRVGKDCVVEEEWIRHLWGFLSTKCDKLEVPNMFDLWLQPTRWCLSVWIFLASQPFQHSGQSCKWHTWMAGATCTAF